MGRKWLELRCTASAANEDELADFLLALTGNGATSINESVDTFELAEPARSTVTLTGYLELPAAEEEKLAALRTFLEELEGRPSQVEVATISEEDWADNWKTHFRPVAAGRRLVIAPPWEDVPDDKLLVRIDPGMAFGTGGHATTRLCLEAIEALLEHSGFAEPLQYGQPVSLLDVGTGSGILAISARMLGVRKVIGIDIDEDAVAAAEGNIALNGINGVEVSTTPLDEIAGSYDILVANIIAEELVRLMPELASRANSFLILSGILVEKEEIVAMAAARHGFDPMNITRESEWSCIVCRRGSAR